MGWLLAGAATATVVAIVVVVLVAAWRVKAGSWEAATTGLRERSRWLAGAQLGGAAGLYAIVLRVAGTEASYLRYLATGIVVVVAGVGAAAVLVWIAYANQHE